MPAAKQVPDGGYGWVMTICSFFIHMWTVGLTFSLGGLYVSWLHEFNESKALTSWVISICSAVQFGIAPLPSVLIARCGNRYVQVFGALLACIGFSCSYFVTSLYQLIVTLGIIGGSGLGFLYMPAVTMLAEYFDKRRAMAYGIATAGAGVGNFLLSPFIEWLENIYGWRGAVLIVGALLLNLSVCGLFMKPMAAISNSECCMKVNPDIDVLETEKHLLVKDVKGNSVQGDGDTHFKKSTLEFIEENHTDESPGVIKPYNKLLVLNHFESIENRHQVGGSFQHISLRASNMKQFSSASDVRPTYSPLNYRRPNKAQLKENGEETKRSFRNIDLLMCGSIHGLHIVDEKIGSKNSLHYNTLSSKLHAGADDEDEDYDSDDNVAKITSDIRGIQRTTKNISCFQVFLEYISLLKDTTFLLLAINTVLVNFSYLVPVIYIVDRAIKDGIDKNTAVLLMSMNGIGNVIGRFLWGCLGNLSWTDTGVLYNTTLILCGIGTCLSPLCGESSILHGIYAAFFGFTMGGYVSLLPAVSVDFLGVARMGQVYGIILFCCGSGGAIGPPFAGFVYDMTGDFTASFIITGVMLILSSFVVMPVTISRLKRKRQELDCN